MTAKSERRDRFCECCSECFRSFVSLMRGPVPIGARLRPSLPGLTPQVGFTRLEASYNCADLGQARGPLQSIDLRKNFLAKKMDARVKPAHDEFAKHHTRVNPSSVAPSGEREPSSICCTVCVYGCFSACRAAAAARNGSHSGVQSENETPPASAGARWLSGISVPRSAARTTAHPAAQCRADIRKA
jgi:hypothetical protein